MPFWRLKGKQTPERGFWFMLKTPSQNTLFYGDNLAILRVAIGDESVDLSRSAVQFQRELQCAVPGAGRPLEPAADRGF